MKMKLYASLIRLAKLQSQSIDRVAIHQFVNELTNEELESPHVVLNKLVQKLRLPELKWLNDDQKLALHAPCLVYKSDRGYGLLLGQNAQGFWLTEWLDDSDQSWIEAIDESVDGCFVVKLQMAAPYVAIQSPVYKLIVDAILIERSKLLEIVVAGVLINFLALGASLYSMQVYDRVVPTGSSQTLLALTLGVLISISFELLLKFVKSNLNEKLVDTVDAELAHRVYSRFTSIRLDQLPSSVGGLASQLKGYETVRSFLSSVPAQLLIDVPFVFLFVAFFAVIGDWLAVVPLVFLFVSLAVGLAFRKKFEELTVLSNSASNLKIGMLVESIEGAETIKSGQGGWRLLSKWIKLNNDARVTELKMRQFGEHSQYLISSLQQVAYVLLVAVGALSISKGSLSMGALIACTILSGRILSPISGIPSMLMQWGYVRAALKGLDALWRLEDDHFGAEKPVILDRMNGHYEFEGVEAYYGQHKALNIPKLEIRRGEKIAILGIVGSGKTTLLRLLSGMYKPQKGRVKIDGVDLSMISKPSLSESVGYLQQEGRLFSGTLRENLVLGMIDPGDQSILDVAQKTGLLQAVISPHPLGLQQSITEGGFGLSGGQRQLANLTRIFLRNPKIWLLDEPTASLDRTLELIVLKALSDQIKSSDTLVIVTHKPELLNLVDRIIVMANHQVLIDGPKAQVVEHLQKLNANINQPYAAT